MDSPLKTYQPDLRKAIDRSLEELPVALQGDESSYFVTNKAPSYLADIRAKITAFAQYHFFKNPEKRLVIITSGGTTVPLENNTVRFIDNFSAGTRGSVSAEELLDHDYAVVFLYRELSFLPYLRHFATDPHHENFLDYVSRGEGDRLEIKPEYSRKLSEILDLYNYHKKNRNIIIIPFTTVNQYLYSLKLVCEVVSRVYQDRCNQIVIYLAAAVSDFYIPEASLPQHKIQSQSNQSAQEHQQISSTTNGGLTIQLSPVPKFLSRIVDSWCPGAFVISFKLETDKQLLLDKCVGSLQKYKQGLVIGNLLQTRTYEVMFVYRLEESFKHHWFRIDKNQASKMKIESIFIPEVIKFHDRWVSKTSEI